jgi:hypothetical protein
MHLLTIFIAALAAVSFSSARVQLHGRWSISVGPLAFRPASRGRVAKSIRTPQVATVPEGRLAGTSIDALRTERLGVGACHRELLHRSAWDGRV